MTRTTFRNKGSLKQQRMSETVWMVAICIRRVCRCVTISLSHSVRRGPILNCQAYQIAKVVSLRPVMLDPGIGRSRMALGRGGIRPFQFCMQYRSLKHTGRAESMLTGAGTEECCHNSHG